MIGAKRMFMDSYAHIFTCTYKHMQSGGQLGGGQLQIFREGERKPLRTRLGSLMNFLAEGFYSEGGSLLRQAFAPCWGIR
jgi:hypothetical protein